MGARGWFIAMIVAMATGIVVSCWTGLTHRSGLAWLGILFCAASLACTARLMDWLEAEPNPPARLSLRGWFYG